MIAVYTPFEIHALGAYRWNKSRCNYTIFVGYLNILMWVCSPFLAMRHPDSTFQATIVCAFLLTPLFLLILKMVSAARKRLREIEALSAAKIRFRERTQSH